MRKITLLLVLIGTLYLPATAQQDPMFTKYMFNSLAFNPAFAGSPEYLQVRLLYRNQWWAIDGAPVTQSFTIHSPFKERVGLGLSVVNDRIGSTGSTSAFVSYAYRVDFGSGKLSIGLQAGAMHWRADWTDLRYRDPRALDEVFREDTPVVWIPNFGAGIFYYSQKYYVGFSVPRLISWDLRRDVTDSTVKWAKYYRHYYFSAGAAFPINGDALYFKPSILIKSVGLLGGLSQASNSLNRVGAPTEFDLDISFLFYESLWLGASFRSAFEAKQFGGNSSFDSIDIWAAFYLRNGMRIGLSYDYSITSLQTYADGSFEVMLGYDMNFEAKRMVTPRYF
ncbi:MAG: type IX secretion system membrane protein PorP/SprF [Bacteroidota bacterium]